ncbi:protein translocase subunit SecF [soil metagenome]
MEFFRIRRDFPFMKHALVFNIISAVTFVLAIVFIIARGFHFSVELTGGTLMEVSYVQAADVARVRAVTERLGYVDAQVQTFGASTDVLIRLPVRASGDAQQKTTAEQSQQLLEALKADNPDVQLRRTEYVGPQVGEELLDNGALALLFVLIGIGIYLALRFEWKFAVSALIANVHDVVIILGFFAAFQWEFSLAVLAAILAILGYSVNESVIIADRIRETFRKMRKVDVDAVIDNAITSTISRTIITHGLTQLVVITMFLFGGPTLHYFALALTIGICFGIYSSVLVMAPLTRWLGIKREDLVKSTPTGRVPKAP